MNVLTFSLQGDIPGWQGDGSNIGFPHLNFGSTEGSSQQPAPGVSILYFPVLLPLPYDTVKNGQ